ENVPRHEHVLPPGEFGMKADAELEQRRDAPARLVCAGRWPDGARDELQQRTLAGAVRADNANRLAGSDVEGHVAQHPIEVVPNTEPDPLREASPFLGVALVGLAEVANAKVAHHSSSTISPLSFRNANIPSARSAQVMTVG